MDRVNASKVSVLDLFRLINVSRSCFDPSASTPWSNDHVGTLGVISRWLRESGTYVVSDFVFSRWIDADVLDLESSIFAPRLPRRPGLHGKPIQPSDILFRFPDRLDCVNASKVSPSGVLRSTDVSRFRFDAAASTLGSNDPIGTSRGVWGISEWLHRGGAYLVSCLNLQRLVNVFRSDLHAATSTPGPMDPMEAFGGV